jgi:hypothetical protein
MRGKLTKPAESRDASEAERLLKRWFISSHVKAQVHAALAIYYESVERDRDG